MIFMAGFNPPNQLAPTKKAASINLFQIKRFAGMLPNHFALDTKKSTIIVLKT